ncbi:MAG: hypothetical protein KIH80_002845 [Flavobacteriia bacterium]|nr:hypothetical protein [Flavobacteriia bacterium]
MKKILFVLGMLSLNSCAVIRPGEAGVKQRLGEFQDEVKTQGVVFFNPITSKVVKESIQTKEMLKKYLQKRLLKYGSIEAFMKLSNSNNAKIIITDGKAPFLIETKDK